MLDVATGPRATKDQSVVLLRAFHTRNFWGQKSYRRQTEDEPKTTGFFSVFPRFDSCKNVEFDAVAASPRWPVEFGEGHRADGQAKPAGRDACLTLASLSRSGLQYL